MKFGTLILLLYSFTVLQAQSSNYKTEQSDIFVFEHTVNQLFYTSTYRVLRPFDFAFSMGSNFNDSGIESFNSAVGIGFGGFLEFQVKTVPQNFTSMNFKANENIAGIKIKLFNENVFTPGFSVGAETNINILNFNVNEEGMKTILPEGSKAGLSEFNFDVSAFRFYGVFTKRIFGATNVSAGLSYGIVGYRNFNVESGGAFPGNDNGNLKMLNYFGGIDFPVNERTKFIFEVYSSSNLLFDLKTVSLYSRRKTSVSAGLRTFMNEWFTVDYGLTYHDYFKSLSEIQLRMNLTAFLNLGI